MSISITSALAEATAELAATGVPEARSDATLLLRKVIDRDHAFVIAHPEINLTAEQLEQFRSLVSRRAAGEPLQYVTGHQEFFKLDFAVTPDVLIPRPETEFIVEAALERFPVNVTFNFADAGTGSGCIAISILHERPQARATAIDISERALKVAQRNAESHQVMSRLRLTRSDLFDSLNNERFDLIVSNPPYVPDDDLINLQREVQREPRSALAGGADGLDVVRRLLDQAREHLHTGGHLIFEFGFTQDQAITELVDRTVWELIEIRRDLQQIPRVAVLRKIRISR